MIEDAHLIFALADMSDASSHPNVSSTAVPRSSSFGSIVYNPSSQLPMAAPESSTSSESEKSESESDGQGPAVPKVKAAPIPATTTQETSLGNNELLRRIELLE